MMRKRLGALLVCALLLLTALLPVTAMAETAAERKLMELLGQYLSIAARMEEAQTASEAQKAYDDLVAMLTVDFPAALETIDEEEAEEMAATLRQLAREVLALEASVKDAGLTMGELLVMEQATISTKDGKHLRLRAVPGTDGMILTRMEPGAQVYLTGNKAGDWVEVVHHSERSGKVYVGYANKAYV